MIPLFELSESKFFIDEHSSLVRRFSTKLSTLKCDEIVYAGHLCRLQWRATTGLNTHNQVIESTKIFTPATNSFYAMDKHIGIIGEDCVLPGAEVVDTLDLCLVSEIHNPHFFESFKNLRVLRANNLSAFPSKDCLKQLKNLKYVEVKRMKEVNAAIPETVRIIKSAIVDGSCAGWKNVSLL